MEFAAELSLVEYHGYVACVLTQILRELEERREGELFWSILPLLFHLLII